MTGCATVARLNLRLRAQQSRPGRRSRGCPRAHLAVTEFAALYLWRLPRRRAPASRLRRGPGDKSFPLAVVGMPPPLEQTRAPTGGINLASSLGDEPVLKSIGQGRSRRGFVLCIR